MVFIRRSVALLYIITSINLSIKVSLSLAHSDDKRYCALKPDHNTNMKSSGCRMGNYLSSEKDSESSSTESSKIYAEERLKQYGYQFIKYGNETRMMSIDDDKKGFEFDVHYGNRELNQMRYEEIGEIITELVYERLERDLKLEKVTIPVNAKAKEAKGFFFKSSNALDAEKILILIHGSGVVRAGQWARSLIINHSWESGTMEPYIKQAQQEGFGIIVTNGNHNFVPGKGKIKGSETPQDHCVYVWKHFINSAKAKDIAVVAHSFGGVVVQHLLRNVPESMKRIKVVAFTDSVHHLGYNEKNDIKQWFRKTTRNWVSSAKPLDEPMTSYFEGSDCGVVSAGTYEHIWTSHYAKDSVFKFIHEKLGLTKQCEEASDSKHTPTVVDDEVEAKKSKVGSGSEEAIAGKTEDVGGTQASGDLQNTPDKDEKNNLQDESMADAGDKSLDGLNSKDESTVEASGESSNDLHNKDESTVKAGGESSNDLHNKDESTVEASGESSNHLHCRDESTVEGGGESSNDLHNKDESTVKVSGESSNDLHNKDESTVEASGEPSNDLPVKGKTDSTIKEKASVQPESDAGKTEADTSTKKDSNSGQSENTTDRQSGEL